MKKKNYLYIKMLNNTPKITTYRQRYRERKRKNVLKKVDGIIKKTKKGYKKWLVIETTHFLMKKKRESMVEINIRICLKKKTKNKKAWKSI